MEDAAAATRTAAEAMSPTPLTSLTIPTRPPKPSYLQTALFAVYFNVTILLVHFSQNIIQPLRLFSSTRPYYQWMIERSKGAFGKILVSMTSIFAPTNLVVSFRDEKGNQLDPSHFVDFNPDGSVKKLNLPKRSIWMGNHQVYTDWLYLWILSYFCGFEESIYIILKESLKWAPIVGIAMQYYDFIFLARSWAKDQVTLSHHLSKLADLSHLNSNPLMLLIFPEGTLVSKDTRPLSKKFADKTGITDCVNLLLPRSTGLLYCSRALKRQIEDLKLVDVTIGYPGIPPAGYGQSYYTLRSIYMQGVPPPSVHLSFTIRNFSTTTSDANDASTAPLGALTKSQLEATESEKQVFDEWLLKRWREKDELMNEFYKNGDFVHSQFASNKKLAGAYYRQRDTGVKEEAEVTPYYVCIPVRLTSLVHWGDVFGWGIPVILGALLYKLWSH
ncbi:unnamed protein product [Sympodiomycopsis kandeliae]